MKQALYTVIAGNRRRVAVEALGWTTVPAIVMETNGHPQHLEEIPIGDLAPNPINPRDKIVVDTLIASIREVGLCDPLLITPNNGSSVLTEPDILAKIWAEQNEREDWPPAASVEFYKQVRAASSTGKKLDTLLKSMGLSDSERRIYGGAAHLGPKTMAFCRDQGTSVSNMNHISNYASKTLDKMGSLPPGVDKDAIQLLIARKYTLPHGGIPRGESPKFVNSYVEALDNANQTQIMVFLTDTEANISNLRLSLGLSKMQIKRTHCDSITRTMKSIDNLTRLKIDMTNPDHQKAIRKMVRSFNALRRHLKGDSKAKTGSSSRVRGRVKDLE